MIPLPVLLPCVIVTLDGDQRTERFGMKDAIATAAFFIWLALNLWLWAAEISVEARFV